MLVLFIVKSKRTGSMPIKYVLYIWIDGVRYGVPAQQFRMIVLSVFVWYIWHSSLRFLCVLFLFMCKCVLLFVSNNFDNEICVESNMNMDDSFFQAADVYKLQSVFSLSRHFCSAVILHYTLLTVRKIRAVELIWIVCSTKLQKEYYLLQMLCGVWFK